VKEDFLIQFFKDFLKGVLLGVVVGGCPPLALLLLLPTQKRPMPDTGVKNHKTVVIIKATQINILNPEDNLKDVLVDFRRINRHFAA